MSIIKQKNWLFPALACFSLLTGCGGGSNKTSVPISNEPAVVEVAFDYQAEINNAISETIPGVVLLVEKADFKFLGAAGVADIETLDAMQTYQAMPTGSSGKKLTALLAVLLEQEGLLNLDDKINTLLGEEILAQIEHSDSITVRQLLNHTSGVFDYLDDSNASTYYNALLLSDPSELKLDQYPLAFALNKPAYSLPGEAFHYSNTGYLLVGLIIDKLLSEHHSVAIRNRILDPLGMTASFYGGIEKELGEIISGYYHDETIGTIDTKPFYENIGFADAPLSSNVEDLAHLLKSIVSNDSALPQDVQARFFDESTSVRLDATREYGLGIFKEYMNGKTVYHHGGIEPGYRTTNIFIEETQTSITAFFNCGLSEQCEAETDKVVHSILNNELE